MYASLDINVHRINARILVVDDVGHVVKLKLCKLFEYYNWPFIIATRCSAIAERPRCRVRYSFRQK